MWPFKKVNDNTTPREHHLMPQYNIGVLAGENGAESWENPYCTPDSGRLCFAYWEAGRCFGMQQGNKILTDNVKVTGPA